MNPTINHTELMAKAMQMSIDQLDAYQRAIFSEAEFLKEMLQIRQKYGERTQKQLAQKARRQSKAAPETTPDKPRTVAPSSKKLVKNDDTQNQKIVSTAAQANRPMITNLAGPSSGQSEDS